MRSLIFAASMLALALGAATLAGCGPVGMGQQSLIGASHNWQRANSVPAAMVGDIIRAGGTGKHGELKHGR
jgi:hypothetical protein